MALITYREALRQALREELERDERVLIVGAEVGYFGGAFKVTEGLLASFGERRLRDLPNASATIVGAGIGAALAGLKPVVELTDADADPYAIDQMIGHAAKSLAGSRGKIILPIVIRITALRGDQSRAYPGQSVADYFANSKTIRVVAPVTPADAKASLRAAIRGDAPVIFIEHESLYEIIGDVPDDPVNTMRDK